MISRRWNFANVDFTEVEFASVDYTEVDFLKR